MVIPSRLPEYIVAAMVIILAPGPSVLFVIARAIAWGRKTAVFTVGSEPLLDWTYTELLW